jgi:hypothetical protein
MKVRRTPTTARGADYASGRARNRPHERFPQAAPLQSSYTGAEDRANTWGRGTGTPDATPPRAIPPEGGGARLLCARRRSCWPPPGARAEAADPKAEAEPAQPPTAPVSEPEQAERPAAVDEGSPPPAQAAVVAPAAPATPAPEQGAARPLPIEKIFTRETLAATPTP